MQEIGKVLDWVNDNPLTVAGLLFPFMKEEAKENYRNACINKFGEKFNEKAFPALLEYEKTVRSILEFKNPPVKE